MPAAIDATMPCPCGGGTMYGTCCGRWHAGPLRLAAPDATALMRSRYAAYVLGLADYLRDTWHASTRPASIELDDSGLRWLGLEVRAQRPHQGGSLSADATPRDQAEVEFVARSKRHGRAFRLHETSRFVREGGRWFYVDGTVHER